VVKTAVVFTSIKLLNRGLVKKQLEIIGNSFLVYKQYTKLPDPKTYYIKRKELET
jgi:hypothetical protein